MAITVQQLVDTPHLRTRFVAGRAGGDQVINWAHSCELEDPWDWLEPLDLLMTNGLGIPKAPGDQVNYVERLADAGLSGVAIGDGVGAPEVTHAMSKAAERRALPVLLTAYEVPFAAVARVVAESKTHPQERMRLIKTAGIYDCVRMAAVEGMSPRELMASLGEQLDCRFQVLDMTSWHDALAPGSTPATATRRVLEEAVARGSGRLPAILRLELDGTSALGVPVPSRRQAVLLASGYADSGPGLSLLQHIATVAALGLEQLISERERWHRAGAELLSALIAKQVASAEAAGRLTEVGLADRELMVAVWHCAPPCSVGGGGSAGLAGDGAVHHELLGRDVASLVLRQDQTVLAVLPAGDEYLQTLLEILPPNVRVGLRDGVVSPTQFPDAAREARWALWALRPEHGRVARYADDAYSSLPFTFASAHDVAEHVLGPLTRYDSEHNSELVRTLAVLLRHNRSANRAAAELFIHRQTLVYRIRRIEQLTRRRLRSTQDIVELWLALRALEVLTGRVLLGLEGAAGLSAAEG